jgi:asparagine synthase (glutamine-hydrolysing)
MCGITGIVDFERDLRRSGALLAAMTETMACRGPDAEGTWSDRHAALGHRRLAVIDLEGGRQPMLFEEQGRPPVCLTYSGEVYNFRELRDELVSRGHRFRTRSDTEVVLRGYLEWGQHVAERLNGIFAFAIWDAGTQELNLVRDPMGVKPLYYYPRPTGVLFGSEPKAVLAHHDVPRRVSPEGLRELFAMVKTPEQAVYQGRYEVRPGQVVRIRRQGLVKRRYWQLQAREHHDDIPATVGTVRSLLEDIVERQTVADVPLCTLLSGGLDSSAVAALAGRRLKDRGEGPIRSFAVGFTPREGAAPGDPARQDLPFARDLAEHIGSDHQEILLDSGSLAEPALRADVMRAFDLPPAFWGDMYPSVYRLFQAVREQSTVALSGEAADELFGGYNWYSNPQTLAAEGFPGCRPLTGPTTTGRCCSTGGSCRRSVWTTSSETAIPRPWTKPPTCLERTGRTDVCGRCGT